MGVHPTPEQLDRVRSAREFVHRTACVKVDQSKRFSTSCILCPTASGTFFALLHLDEHPRDARGARRLLHDVVCGSSCPPDDFDHSDRTQSTVVAALRKFRAQE